MHRSVAKHRVQKIPGIDVDAAASVILGGAVHPLARRAGGQPSGCASPVVRQAPRSAIAWRQAFVALVACNLIAGCAINPYIANTRPDTTAHRGSPIDRLDIAYDYANRTQDAYAQKLSDEYDRQQLLSGGIIAIGAATLGLAAFNAHRDAIKAAALLGGTTYALGTWNTNQGRLGIYLEGMKATTCAKAAVAPLHLDREQLDALHREIRTTIDAASSVADAVGDVTHWLAIASSAEGATQSPLTRAAEVELVAVPGTLTKAGDLLSQAASLDRRVGSAGALLEAKIDEIVRLVDAALNGTLAELSALPKVIAGISDYANIFAPGLDLGSALTTKIAAGKGAAAAIKKGNLESESVGGAPDASAELARALGILRAQTLRLNVRMPILAGLVEPMSAGDVKAALVGCGVDASKTAAAMKLARSTVQFVAGKAGTSIVTVSGGTMPLQASFLDLPVQGITVSVPPDSRAIVIVSDTTTASDSTYRLSVRDAAGASATVVIKVVAKEGIDQRNTGDAANKAVPKKKKDTSAASNTSAAPASVAADTAAKADDKRCLLQGRSVEQVCLVQSTLKVPLTGKLDDATCGSLRKEKPPARDGILNDSTMDAIAQKGAYPGALDGPSIVAFLGQKQQTCPGAMAKPAVTTTPAAPSAPAATTCAATSGKSAFECGLTAEQIASVRMRLLHNDKPARFDDSLRDAIRKLQQSRSVSARDGVLDSETLKFVQTLPKA